MKGFTNQKMFSYGDKLKNPFWVYLWLHICIVQTWMLFKCGDICKNRLNLFHSYAKLYTASLTGSSITGVQFSDRLFDL